MELNIDLHPNIQNVCVDKAALLFHFCRSKHFYFNEPHICRFDFNTHPGFDQNNRYGLFSLHKGYSHYNLKKQTEMCSFW